MKKYSTILKMTGFPLYLAVNLAATMIYAGGILSGKIIMFCLSPVYVILIYYMLWRQQNNYTVIHKETLYIVPLTAKSAVRCYNFAIISNLTFSAVLLIVILAVYHNKMSYFIAFDFVVIALLFYGSCRLKIDDVGRTMLYISMGIATGVIFMVESGIL